MTYLTRRQQLLDNRSCLNETFRSYKYTAPMISFCGVVPLAMEGVNINAETLARIGELVGDSLTSQENNFHSSDLAFALQVSLLALSDDPKALHERSLELYEELRQAGLGSGAPLFLAAILVARQVKPDAWHNVIARAVWLYSALRLEHPFLSSHEEIILCVLSAFSTQSDRELIDRTEQAFQKLYGYFPISMGGSVLSAAQVLALYPGDVNDMCQRLLALTRSLTSVLDKPHSSLLPMLVVLAQDPRPTRDLALLSADTCHWLKEQTLDERFSLRALVFDMSAPITPRLLLGALLTQENGSTADAPLVAGVNSAVLTQAAFMVSALHWIYDRYHNK